jgi:RNA polymerase sigma factor (sigma-70 family)
MKNIIVSNEIYNHTSDLQKFAIGFTQDLEDANDLVQDTFLRAISYSAQFKDGTNLKAWLYTIMRNTFINNYRRNKRIRTFVDTSEDLNSAQLMKSSLQNEGQNLFINDDIFKALDKLEPQYSVPFMRYFEGYKYQEIAEELNIPIGTVKTRIHYARQILKKNLKMYSDGFSQQTVN